MLTSQDRRSEPQSPARLAATIMSIVLLGMGYVISPQVDSAVERSNPVVAQDQVETPYFPSQYVNQGTILPEHIQAF